MPESEFKATWDALLTIARMVLMVERTDIVKLIETADMGDALGPILDPTAYRRGMGNLEDQRTIGNALLNLRDAVQWVNDHPGLARR